MILNEFVQIAYDEWIKLSERFPNFTLDVFQIMPNHIHETIVLNDIAVGAGFTPAHNHTITENDADIRAGASPCPYLFFKSSTVMVINLPIGLLSR